MKTIVSALFVLVGLAFAAAPEARAQAPGCTSSPYNMGDAAGEPYTLQICGREVTLNREGFAFFEAMVNDEGPFLEGSIRYGDRCGAQNVPAASEDVPDWYRGPPPKLVIRMQQPTFDAGCRSIGESEVVYEFVAAGAGLAGGGMGGAGGECWLVVYGLFDRAEYDSAKQLVQRIGPGTAVVDTDPIVSLPKSRFAVVSGPHSAADADSVQRNTRPVAPNAIVMRANDCGDVGGAPGGAAALAPTAPPLPGLPAPGTAASPPGLVPFGGAPAAATGAPPGMTLYGSPPAAGGPPGLTPFGGAPPATTGTPPGLTPFGGAPATGTPPGLTPFGGAPAGGTPPGLTPYGGAAATGTPPGLTPFGGAPASGGTPPAGLTPFGTVPPKPLPLGVKPVG